MQDFEKLRFLPTSVHIFEWGENNDVMMALYMDFLALGN